MINTPENLEKLEIDLLFEAMFRRYGYDFRNYAYDSARRRVLLHMKTHEIQNVADLQHRIVHDEHSADTLLIDLSINVTEMFRDPLFFKTIRQHVLPSLAQEEHIKIWHAGCSSGEEAYSMAILLHELKLLSHSQIYATDFNNNILEKAKQGIFDIKNMRLHIKNYQNSGGAEEFTNYYHAEHEYALLNHFLKKKIMFSNHNLVSDTAFGEMHLIICRNVLIYFDKKLQEQVFKLFFDSLGEGGILCLGSHETLCLSQFIHHFDTLSEQLKIYKKRI